MQKLAILGKNVVNRTETILRYYIQFSVRFCAVSLTKIHVSGLGPVTPLQILLKMETDDLYTIQNPNPKLQPNRPAQFLQQALPSLPYLDFQVGQAGQSLLEKLSWPIWLQTLNC